jgi:hypothetical protein
MEKRFSIKNKNKKFFIFYSQMIVDRTTWVTSPTDRTPLNYRLDTQLLIPLYRNIFFLIKYKYI